MLPFQIENYPAFFLLFTALLINVPCGYIRRNHPKFSLKWFFWVHASIPVIIYLRITWGTSPWFIPLTIFMAIVGQIVGSYWRDQQMSQQQKDIINQIDHLNIKKEKRVDESELLVALLNMGGPRKNSDVPDFQKHLFSDPLLIRFPLSSIFQKFFAWLLVTLRSKAVAELYQLIGGGSPIYKSTTSQARALREELHRRNRKVEVTYSFNYSPPFPKDTIRKAQIKNKQFLLPLSLYPHYSKATTGSNVHYLRKEASQNLPQLQFLDSPPYYLHPGYIQAFVDRIKETIAPNESLDDFYLLFSAHGLPLYFLTEGDPYPFQISQTVAAIVEKLGRQENWIISYQSAVGPLQWLKPSTEDMIDALYQRGIRKLLIVPVSFVGDHIETLCEIDIEYREVAKKLGLHDYRMSKAIECHPGFINALADCVESVLNQSAAVQEKKDRPQVTVNV